MSNPTKTCFHCGDEISLPITDVNCEYGGNENHCKDCVYKCEKCGEYFCDTPKSGLCEECYKVVLEETIEKINEPLSEALGKLNYILSGERHLDDYTIFEFSNWDGLPSLELRLKTSEVRV